MNTSGLINNDKYKYTNDHICTAIDHAWNRNTGRKTTSHKPYAHQDGIFHTNYENLWLAVVYFLLNLETPFPSNFWQIPAKAQNRYVARWQNTKPLMDHGSYQGSRTQQKIQTDVPNKGGQQTNLQPQKKHQKQGSFLLFFGNCWDLQNSIEWRLCWDKLPIKDCCTMVAFNNFPASRVVVPPRYLAWMDNLRNM